MKDIIVICAKNDFPNYGGSYSNGPLDGWNCVYIEENIDENISLIDAHGAPVTALRKNQTCRVVVNGNEKKTVPLADLLKSLVSQ